jgi:hypothetical protein
MRGSPMAAAPLDEGQHRHQRRRIVAAIGEIEGTAVDIA